MSRPTILLKDSTMYWTIRTYDPTDGVTLIDADTDPSTVILKNGSITGDSANVGKRAASTGIYDCSYNPSGEEEGDYFTIEEYATINSGEYDNSWEFVVMKTASDIAKAVLTETVSGIEDDADEHSLATVILATTEHEISGNDWIIYKADGVTTYVTKTVTGSASAEPIIKIE